MSTAKTWLVTFSVHDSYKIKLCAETADAAIFMAEDLYCAQRGNPFEFARDNNGTCNWDAVEVAP